METSDSTQDMPRQPNDTRGSGTVTFAEFIKVTGVIVACIAIIASLAYPVVTAALWGG